MLSNILANPCHIGIIQRGVYFVQDEKGGRLVAVDGEEEGESGDGFLAAGEVLHVTEAFEGGHGVVFYPREVGLVTIFYVEVAKGGGGEWC